MSMTDKTPKGRLGRNILVSVVFTVALMVLSFLSSVVVARLGGPEARGLLSLGQSFFALVGSLASLGLGYATTWAMGQGHPRRQILGLFHGVTLATMLLGFAATAAIFAWWGGVPSSDIALAGAACGAGLWVANYSEYVRGYFIGAHRVVAYNLVQSCNLVVFIGLNLVLLKSHRDWVLLNVIIAYMVVGALAFVSMVRADGWPQLPGRALTRETIPFGIKASLTLTAEYALLRLDALLLAAFVATEQVGIYSIGDQLNHVAAVIPLIIGRMMFAESALATDGVASRRKLGIVVRLVIPFMTLAVLGGAATFWFLIPLVFGEPFRESYIAFVILMPTAICKSIQTQFSTYLTGQGLQKRVIAAGVVGVVTDVIALLVLVPQIGWTGAAYAKVLGYIAQLILVVRAYRVAEPDGEHLHWLLGRGDIDFLVGWVRGRLAARKAAD
jgi:O-antigen/teichoic acid export membrane protein